MNVLQVTFVTQHEKSGFIYMYIQCYNIMVHSYRIHLDRYTKCGNVIPSKIVHNDENIA